MVEGEAGGSLAVGAAAETRVRRHGEAGRMQREYPMLHKGLPPIVRASWQETVPLSVLQPPRVSGLCQHALVRCC